MSDANQEQENPEVGTPGRLDRYAAVTGRAWSWSMLFMFLYTYSFSLYAIGFSPFHISLGQRLFYGIFGPGTYLYEWLLYFVPVAVPLALFARKRRWFLPALFTWMILCEFPAALFVQATLSSI